jgi:hypothetical protein
LPSVGNSGIKRKARFIKIIQIDVALVFVFLSGFQLLLALGKGIGIAQLLSRLPHPLPSKTRLFGSTFQRGDADGLLGLLGDVVHYHFERTRLVLERLPGEGLLGRRKWARSATARLIMQAFRSVLFPCADPSRHGDTMDLIGLGNVLDRLALSTQQQTMSATPRSEGGIVMHRFVEEYTLLFGQRLYISHDPHLIRSGSISHEKLCSIDEV